MACITTIDSYNGLFFSTLPQPSETRQNIKDTGIAVGGGRGASMHSKDS